MPLQGRAFELACGCPPFDQLRQFYRRATCAIWWKSQLKRAWVRTYETTAVRTGGVGKRAAVYCSDETVRRRELDCAANAVMLERTEIEAADGTVIALKAAFDASPSSKPIRRGELMTRLRGCEEWAEAKRMVGLFTTNTAPSRFHSVGGANSKYDGSTPREAQNWLRDTWAACRAKLQRDGVRFFGFRVAEPHADGCPHWHMLLWCEAEQVERLKSVMHKWWRRDEGAELGAKKHRCLIKTMNRGEATGYVAKYIAKNVDDFGAVAVEGHKDDAQGELIDGSAKRVEAWASAWGIRQFQAFGQPPITVWRELRRVDASAAQGASPSLRAAHEAVNRVGERKACYRAYLDAQGGAMTGRGYRLRVHAEAVSREGRYGTVDDKRPLGVVDVERPGEVALSNRKAWKPRGTWTDAARSEARVGLYGEVRDLYLARPQAAQPWTRVINCTRAGGAASLMSAGIVGASSFGRPGGQPTKDFSPCLVPPKSSPRPSRPPSSPPISNACR